MKNTYLGLNPETDAALQSLRTAYALIHSGRSLNDIRLKRAGRRELELARRAAREAAWH